MKRNYIRLKNSISIIMVIVLLVSIGIITYQRADDIRFDYILDINDTSGLIQNLRLNEVVYNDDFIQQVYLAYSEVKPHSDDIGFYSMLKDKDGNTLAEYQNFVTFKKGGDEDYRILLLEDDFLSDNEEARICFQNGSIVSMEILGTCDDTYVYLDSMKWSDYYDNSYSYSPTNKNSAVTTETKKFEEWAGDKYYYEDRTNNNEYYPIVYLNSHIYGDFEESQKLNDEAKEICNQIYSDYANGIDTWDSQKSEGIFNCYVGGTGYLNDDYANPFVYVFHPINIAIQELVWIYVLIFLVGLVIIVLFRYMVNNLYEQQLAYEANRRKLTRGIAHELKTPLAITKGYVENWEYLDEKDRPEYSKIMIDEIEHMNRMVTDLLELSRLEAKVKEVNLESVDVYELAKNVLRRMQETIEERGLIVSLMPNCSVENISDAIIDNDVADEDSVIEGKFLVNADLEMMRVVLVNFISNAVKYADKEIDICLSENRRKIRFTIMNDGKTIDKIDKVWDEFYRDDTQDNSRIGSSGLGLAITKNILILHRAGYGCKSQNGKTSFWFEIKKDTQE